MHLFLRASAIARSESIDDIWLLSSGKICQIQQYRGKSTTAYNRNILGMSNNEFLSYQLFVYLGLLSLAVVAVEGTRVRQ